MRIYERYVYIANLKELSTILGNWGLFPTLSGQIMKIKAPQLHQAFTHIVLNSGKDEKAQFKKLLFAMSRKKFSGLKGVEIGVFSKDGNRNLALAVFNPITYNISIVPFMTMCFQYMLCVTSSSRNETLKSEESVFVAGNYCGTKKANTNHRLDNLYMKEGSEKAKKVSKIGQMRLGGKLQIGTPNVYAITLRNVHASQYFIYADSNLISSKFACKINKKLEEFNNHFPNNQQLISIDVPPVEEEAQVIPLVTAVIDATKASTSTPSVDKKKSATKVSSKKKNSATAVPVDSTIHKKRGATAGQIASTTDTGSAGINASVISTMHCSPHVLKSLPSSSPEEANLKHNFMTVLETIMALKRNMDANQSQAVAQTFIELEGSLVLMAQSNNLAHGENLPSLIASIKESASPTKLSKSEIMEVIQELGRLSNGDMHLHEEDLPIQKINSLLSINHDFNITALEIKESIICVKCPGSIATLVKIQIGRALFPYP